MLTCPKDRLPLFDLKCSQGHQYLDYDGIPVLLRDDVPETFWFHSRSIKQATGEIEVFQGDYISNTLAAAGGYLYRPLTGKMKDYPIPDFPLNGKGNLLDVGCNWGRWSIAAAKKGYEVVGIDLSLDALLAARKVSRELGLRITFICADARYLPFDRSFDQSFSFSVLQHFSKPDARLAVNEMKRVSDRVKIQFAGKFGIRSLYHQIKRGFRNPKDFEVRYWTKKELSALGDTRPQGFFGTGVLKSDVKYLPWKYKAIPYASDFLTQIKLFESLADSYWITS